MILRFKEWQHINPGKMKQPGITMPQDMKKLVARDNRKNVNSLVAFPKDDGTKS